MKHSNRLSTAQTRKTRKTFAHYIAYALIGAGGLAASLAMIVGEPARAEIAVANAASLDLTQAPQLLGLEN